MLKRRTLLTAGLAMAVAPALAQTKAQLRGALDGGAAMGSARDLQRLLDRASEADEILFLPAGTYVVSNLTLPRRTRIAGIAGATRLVFSGDGTMVLGEDLERVELTDLTFDGQSRFIPDRAKAMVDLRRVAEFRINGCTFVDSGKTALALESVAGRVERSTFTGAAEHALYSVQARGLTIRDNTVANCRDGGILVHRWEAGPDGTLVTGNRVSRIGAASGGTGQVGNGINLFRADGVSVTDNSIEDCAFSAIRSNGSSNITIAGNRCLRSGETGLYAEFAFQGAVIANNVVDGAANGISVVNFNEGGRMAAVTGNIVRNLSTTGPYRGDPPGFGIGISVEADTTVTGNVIEGAPLFGINIGWGEFMRNVVATSNVIRASRIGISVTAVPGAGRALIAENVIDGASEGAIIGHRWTERATPDLAVSPESAPANVSIGRNTVS